MIRLLDIYTKGEPRFGAINFLYDLMKEREPEMNISHRELPSLVDHVRFVKSHPYRFWYLIEYLDGASPWVGYVSATHNNEIGVMIRKAWRGLGFGPEAISQLILAHRPLTGIPSERVGRWLANIAPQNEHSRHVFMSLGFRKISETFELPEEETHGRQDPAPQLHQEQPTA